MTDVTALPERRARLRPAKRQAIIEGASREFGRVGYSRTSIELIAAEANVSTRTIYKHFDSKIGLFAAVLVESAATVADAFEQAIDAPLTRDAERDVTVIAKGLVAHRTRFPTHFAMVQKVSAESDQFPPDVINEWLRAGPRRVRAAIIRRLDALVEAGQLEIPDRSTAARHLVALTNSTVLAEPIGGRAPNKAQLAAAVRVFVRGYGPATPATQR